MQIKDRIEIAVLVKYYGNILTDKQKQVIDMYVDNNLSLQEVADELKITRQAVKSNLDVAVATLKKHEELLGFVERDNKIRQKLEEISSNDINEETLSYIINLFEEE